jgi:hypothetical protein
VPTPHDVLPLHRGRGAKGARAALTGRGRAVLEKYAGKEEVLLALIAAKVRKTPSWPRSWANFSIL